MRNRLIEEALQQLDVVLYVVEMTRNQIEVHFNDKGDSFSFHYEIFVLTVI